MAKQATKARKGDDGYSRVPLQLPVIKFEDEVERKLRIDTAFTKSTRVQDEKKGGKKMDPATVCSVTDVDTGEQGTLIVNAVLLSTIGERYPKDSYVTKTFGITRHAKEKGKRYYKFSLFELKK